MDSLYGVQAVVILLALISYSVSKKLLYSENMILSLLANYCRDSIFALADKYHTMML